MQATVPMPDEQGLILKAQQFGARIAGAARRHENVIIVCHHDADGICSAALLSRFIFKNGGHCEIRAVSEPSVRNLAKISQGKYDLVLFADIATGLSDEIEKHLGDKWLVIDHHPPPETASRADERILNPWQFEIDGSKEISSAGLVHLLTEKNRWERSSFFAVVGALGDGQDAGPKRSLISLNAKILEESQDTIRNIETSVDLLFYGRDTRPVHEAVAFTTSCFVPGLTGNKDACLASLRGQGIELKANTRWRTVADFAEDDKQQILGAILPHLSGTTNTVEDLVGTVYTLGTVDEYSLMHDARDFASTLSACGRMGKTGLALLLCLGMVSDRSSEVDRTVSDYRAELVRAVQTLSASADRSVDRAQYTMIIADGVVGERMTGAVCSALAEASRAKNKIVFLRTTTVDGDVKVSARLGKGAQSNLGSLLRSAAKTLSGVGGGHYDKAGARFSIAKQQEFQEAVDALFQIPRLRQAQN